MIKTWKHKGLKDFFETGSTKGIPAKHSKRIGRILDAIDSASEIEDLNIPGFDLHELKGDRKGTWAITVTGNWRITFKFINGDAYDVNYEDYH
jgi:proteic killer suppression protein